MITSTQESKINKMNRAAQDASLGTMVKGFQASGSHLVSAAEASASAVVINSGLGTIHGQIVQNVRSGSLAFTSASQIGISNASGSLTIIGKAAGVISTNDVINYILIP